MNIISGKDREVLRELAKKQLEIARSVEMTELKKLWLRHNMRQGERPMIVIETGTFAQDIIPDLQKCEGEYARTLERKIWTTLVNNIYFKDDTVVKDFFPVSIWTPFVAFGIDLAVDRAEDASSLGHHFKESVTELGNDFHLLKKSNFWSEKKRAEDYVTEVNSIFGDILPAELTGSCVYAVLTQELVHRMSMQTMLMSMYDYPEEFMKMMDMLTSDYIDYYRFLEKERLLMSTTEGEYVGQGTYAYTTELVKKENPATRDLWGFMDSQETVGISPEMFGEFIFPFYYKLSKEYGLLSYGCCEPVHPFWDKYLSKMNNLRKVSVSPWCDEKFMGERLAGSDIIYHRKPSPNYLGVGATLDEEAVRKHIKTTMDSAKGCKIEFTQRDVYTVNKDIEKVTRYVEIIRRLAEYKN